MAASKRLRMSGSSAPPFLLRKTPKLAVNILLIDPSSNKLSGVTGLRVFFEARYN
jgi:hypothetical protein